METSAHDILIIGGGGAGLRAAIEIAQQNPSLNVAMVSKVYPMRSHTVSAEGGAAGVAGKDDTIDESIKVRILGLHLMNVVGANVLSAAVKSLRDEMKAAGSGPEG